MQGYSFNVREILPDICFCSIWIPTTIGYGPTRGYLVDSNAIWAYLLS